MIIFFQKKEDQVFTTSHFDARDTKKYGYLAMTMLLPSYFYDLTSCGIWDFEMLFTSISISIVYFEAKFSFEEISQINIAVIRKGICYFYFHKHTLRKCTYILLLIYVCVYYYLCILICSAWWRSIYILLLVCIPWWKCACALLLMCITWRKPTYVLLKICIPSWKCTHNLL